MNHGACGGLLWRAIIRGCACRTLREIKLLRFLKHDNIIALVDIQPPEVLICVSPGWQMGDRFRPAACA